MTHQGTPPSRAGRTWAEPDDTDGDLPPWAGPGIKPRMAGPSQTGRHDGTGPLQASRRQRAQARAKRARRWLILWAAVAVAVIAVAVVEVPKLLSHPKPVSPMGNLVTTFQPGEIRTVPSACAAVTAATLNTYLPGTRHKVVPHSLDGRAQSMCDWTVDAPPMYRLLDVSMQAYTPSGLASGNGSATNAAIDAYQQAMQQKAHPPKASHQPPGASHQPQAGVTALPPATVTPLPGLGSAAFSALQVPVAGGDRTDLVTVVVRQRNVLITVLLDGLAHSPGGRYGHVSVPQLQAGAAAAARDLLAALR